MNARQLHVLIWVTSAVVTLISLISIHQLISIRMMNRRTESLLAEAKLRNYRTIENLRQLTERFEAASEFQRPAKAPVETIRIESSVLQLWILDSDGQILRYDEWCSKNNRSNDGFFRGDLPSGVKSVYDSERPSKEAFENW